MRTATWCFAAAVLSIALPAGCTAAGPEPGTAGNPVVWAVVIMDDTAGTENDHDLITGQIYDLTGIHIDFLEAPDHAGILELLDSSSTRLHMTSLNATGYLKAVDQKRLESEIIGIRNSGLRHDGMITAVSETETGPETRTIEGLLPNTGVQFHPDVSSDTRQQIINALFQIQRTESGRDALYSIFGWEGLERQGDEFYDNLRTEIEDQGIRMRDLQP